MEAAGDNDIERIIENIKQDEEAEKKFSISSILSSKLKISDPESSNEGKILDAWYADLYSEGTASDQEDNWINFMLKDERGAEEATRARMPHQAVVRKLMAGELQFLNK